MKTYLKTAALVGGIFSAATHAIAHPGHTLEIVAGHSHTADYAVMGIIGVALLIIALAVLWKRGR